MGGTESGQASNTYPAPMVASFQANPGTFSGAASPLGVTTIPTITATAWVGIVGYPTYGSFASNELANGSFLYSVNPIYGSPSTGFINGSVSTKVSGQLVFYFKVQWQGGSSPTVPMPKSISLLLNTNLFATTRFFYGNSGLTSGLSAFSSASDGPPFNETASSTGPTSVIGYHLVQAAVAPLTTTAGIAQVYLNGTVVQTASDPIPAGAYDAVHGYHVTNGMTQASADSEVTAGVRPDSRKVTLRRDSAHGETQDLDGTIHGDTTYAYYFNNLLTNNSQSFYPTFAGTWSPNPNYISTGTGPLFNISWQWNPASQAANLPDTWNSHFQYVDVGTLWAGGSPSAYPNYSWTGTQDPVKHTTISYTATDLKDHATAAATYDLRVHDQYDNWRRVDTKGNLVSGTAPGDPTSSVQVGTGSATMPSTPIVSPNTEGVDWNAVGIVGGGVLSGGSIALLAVPEPPTWPIIILGLAGLGVTTVSSIPPPPPPKPILPPTGDHFDAAALQTAYQNYVSNLTATPGQQNTSSLVDANLYAQLKANPNFPAYFNGNYPALTATATVYQKMLSYYFYADQYDRGGLVSTTASSTVHVPGDYVWSYLWSNGSVTPPKNP